MFDTAFDSLAYADENDQVVFIEFGRHGVHVPAEEFFWSPLVGTDPAVVFDDNGDWRVVHTDGRDTIDWQPGIGFNSVGPEFKDFDATLSTVAARDPMTNEIWRYEPVSGSWDWLGVGGAPSSWGWYAAWSENGSVDSAIGWSDGWSSGLAFDGDGLEQGGGAAYENLVAYEARPSSGGDWDIRVGEPTSETEMFHLVRAGTQGVQDFRYEVVLFWEFDPVQGRRAFYLWAPFDGGTVTQVPLATDCEPELGRLGGIERMTWVAYEAVCPNGRAEMRVVNMDSQKDWLVGYKFPSHGSHPQFAITEDKLAFVHEYENRIVYYDLDESQL